MKNKVQWAENIKNFDLIDMLIRFEKSMKYLESGSGK